MIHCANHSLLGDASPRVADVPANAEASGFVESPGASHFGLERFRRVTSSGRFVPEIDGLRFVAILMVYLFHLRGYLLVNGLPYAADPSLSLAARVLEQGNYGVQLFFVISGFVLALPFASHHLRGSKTVSLRAYFLRRLTRLEPPYALSMLLFFVMSVVYVGQSASALLPHLAASLIYLHNVIYGTGSLINSVAWSLEVEIQFYILVPLLAQLFAIRNKVPRRLATVGLIVAAMVFQWIAIPAADARLSISILNYLQFFLFGFLLADVYLSEWRSEPTQIPAWDLVSCLGWPLLPVLWHYPDVSRWLFPPITFALYCATFRGVWSRKLFSNRWITTIGGMCYTIYLLHYPIISFVGRHTIKLRVTNDFDTGFVWQFLLITPILIAACAVYFYLVEKPCMRSDWPKRLAATVRLLTPADRTA